MTGIPFLFPQNTEIAEVERVLGEKFKKTDGPFFRTLECTLASLHVERHAYHGGTFVGNHVHKLVQVKCCILYMYHTQ